MPKVSVYLPDALYNEVRRRGIAVSPVAQRALEDELRRHANIEWIEHARTRSSRTDVPIDTAALLGDVRDEFGS